MYNNLLLSLGDQKAVLISQFRVKNDRERDIHIKKHRNLSGVYELISVLIKY
jgi:hypothetical protein